MVAVSKAEKDRILEVYPETHIVRTAKQKSNRHHYYMTEDDEPMKLLEELRSKN